MLACREPAPVGQQPGCPLLPPPIALHCALIILGLRLHHPDLLGLVQGRPLPPTLCPPCVALVLAGWQAPGRHPLPTPLPYPALLREGRHWVCLSSRKVLLGAVQALGIGLISRLGGLSTCWPRQGITVPATTCQPRCNPRAAMGLTPQAGRSMRRPCCTIAPEPLTQNRHDQSPHPESQSPLPTFQFGPR